MAHPGLANVSCQQCKTHIYTIPEGKLQTYETDDGPEPVLRYDAPTPCDECPRGGPENESKYELTERTRMAWMLYEKIQATSGGYQLPEHLASDPLFADNMRLVAMAKETGKAEAQRIAYERAARDASSPIA